LLTGIAEMDALKYNKSTRSPLSPCCYRLCCGHSLWGL